MMTKKFYIYLALYSCLILAIGLVSGRNSFYFFPPEHFQGRPGGPPPRHHGGEDFLRKKMARDLGLSQQQQQQINEIFKKYKPEMEENMERTRQEFDALNKKIQQEVDLVLTPAQKERFNKIHLRERGGFRPPPPPPPPQ
ncbi:MAG: hypothetical protein PHV30_04620 [Candidatus Margulisbacteria bacterium]|nr:hypothetical protein [Candidatus Margulisiibacteriota bacterium]